MNNVTMTWFAENEATRQTDELLDELSGDAKAFVAQNWPLELIKVLLGANFFTGLFVRGGCHCV